MCRAQPAMASLWNAALAAANDEGQPARFERFVHRVQRAPSALTRFACQLFAGSDAPGAAVDTGPLSLVTLSNSGSVRQAFEELARTRPLRVACAEGRPAFEGRRLAETLADAGIAVTLFSDAAIAEAVRDANAVVVGADAVASDWFMNKVGTRMLAAAASIAGVPVYAIASRDKFCAPALSPCISPCDGAADEIWDAPPSRVAVRNPYFERVPLELLVAVITDGGIMPAADVARYCASLESRTPAELVRQLAQW
jgi:translation initiation factor 2B subunit (eIF-2B alpha/beta/delta family)